MSFTRIGQILPETIKRQGLLPDDYKVVSFADGTLTVSCRSAGAIARLRTRDRDLRASFPGVQEIRFLLSPWR